MAVAVAGGAAALSGGMTLGAVQAFLQYYGQVSEPITQMSYVITSTQAAIAGAELVFSLLDEPEEKQETFAVAADIPSGYLHNPTVRPEKTDRYGASGHLAV